jgi:hypothetical protein
LSRDSFGIHTNKVTHTHQQQAAAYVTAEATNNLTNMAIDKQHKIAISNPSLNATVKATNSIMNSC